MTEALRSWMAVGPMEVLLLATGVAALVVGWAVGRWPRVDAALATVGASVIGGLGSFAAHQRLAAIPWQLSQTPERQLVGRIAQSEAEAASVLGGALLLAAGVGAGWAWRRSPPDDGPVPVGPTLVATVATALALLGARLPGGLPSPGDAFGGVALAAFGLVVGSALRPSLRWLAPALGCLIGTALLCHGALLRGLVLDPDVGSALPDLVVLRNVGAALASLACLASLPALRQGTPWPLLGLLACLVPPATQLPDQWARHPAPTPWGAELPHPGVEPTRLAGGCVVGPSGDRRALGLRSEAHGLVGCEPGGLLTVSAPPDLPLSSLVALAGPAPDVGVLTSLGAPSEALSPWFTARWSLPIWRMEGEDPEPRPVRGSLVVTELVPPRIVGPDGPTDLATALGVPGRAEVLVHPSAGTLEELHALCAEAIALRPQGTRCGLALGDPEAWSAWARRPMPGF